MSVSNVQTIKVDSCGGRFFFDEKEADRVCEFFAKHLIHWDGEFAGQPFELLPWQSDHIIRPLFGWKNTATGLRRFKKLSLWVARKNGKSSLAAGIALAALFIDHEPGAMVYSAASDRKQASIVFGMAKNLMGPALQKRCKVYRRSITVESSMSAYHILSSDVKSAHGENPSCVIFDELHTQRNRDLYDAVSTGRASRRQPLFVEISTAGDNPESLAREEYDYSKRVIQGIIPDESFLPVIFEADPGDDWRKPATWAQANPSLGITVNAEYLRDEVAAAQAEPRKQANFERLHLNRWTQQAETWIPLDSWDACDAPVNRESLIGKKCWMGMDLSTKIDLTSAVLAFREPVEGTGSLNYRVVLLPFFWMPEETLREHIKSDAVPYDLWLKQGLIRTTRGNVVDYDEIVLWVKEIAKVYKVQQIALDPWNSTQIATALMAAGFTTIEVRQGSQSMSEPSKVFEALIKSKRIVHGGHKVLRWNVANVSAKEDKKENIFPHKASKKARIDGVIATILAISRMILAPTMPTTVQAPIRVLEGIQIGV